VLGLKTIFITYFPRRNIMLQKLFSFRSVAGLFSGLLLAGLASSAEAIVITGEIATASTTFLGSATATVDDSGLSGGLHGNALNTMWLSATTNSSGGDPDPWLLIDLGAVYDITSFTQWPYNLNGAHTKGIKNVDIRYSATNPAGTGNLLGAYVFSMSNGDGVNPIPGETFNASFTARYIKLDINSSYDTDFGDPNIGYGLSEIQFTGELVPEPTTAALLGIGAVLIGTCQRKRRSS
jgi:hypothetical protein